MVRVLEFSALNAENVGDWLLKSTVPEVKLNVALNTELPVHWRVMSALSMITSAQTAVAVTVTVAAVPELALKRTLSPAIGADAPAAPPEVADQLAVEALSHVPEPPTQ